MNFEKPHLPQSEEGKMEDAVMEKKAQDILNSSQKAESTLREKDINLYNLNVEDETLLKESTLRFEYDEREDHFVRMVGTVKGHEVNIEFNDGTEGTIDGETLAKEDAQKILDKYERIARLGTKKRKREVDETIMKQKLADLGIA